MTSIAEQVAKMGPGPLSEVGLKEHVWPMFSRVLSRGDEIYLANHSLGRPLDQTAEDIREGFELWYSELDGAWSDTGWPGEAKRFQAAVAKLIGHSSPSGIIPKSSAGQGLRAVLNAYPVDRPINVVSTRGEFDSIDFILKVYEQKGRANVHWVDLDTTGAVPMVRSEIVCDAIQTGVDLVVVSYVCFTTGQIVQIEPVIARAHEVGAKILVDAYHSVGVIPVQFDALQADFIVGGSYKYVRGGPGACWLAIAPSNLEMETLDSGWFAKADHFGYHREDGVLRAEGGQGWMESTPPVLIPYQARAGLELLNSIGVDRLREFSLEQLAILRNAFVDNKLNCHVPDDPSGFGAFCLVHHPHPGEAVNRLKNAGVNTDSRGSFIRFGPDFLNSRDELERAAEIVGRVLRG